MSNLCTTLLRFASALLLSAMLAACSSDEAPACESDLDCFSGEACEGGSCTAVACLATSQACEPGASLSCCDGLFCEAEEPCNVETEGGCMTRGTCEPKREVGEPCTDPSQCAGPGAFCAGPENGQATCQVASEDLDQQRCESSADCSSADGIRRSCEDTYCKRMSREPCEANNQCVSNRCSVIVGGGTCS